MVDDDGVGERECDRRDNGERERDLDEADDGDFDDDDDDRLTDDFVLWPLGDDDGSAMSAALACSGRGAGRCFLSDNVLKLA